MNRPELSITVTVATTDITLLTIDGKLDLNTENLVRDAVDALLARNRAYLVFDLSTLTFCDSTGMGMFIDLHHHASTHAGWTRLAALRPFVLQSFRLLNLNQILDLYDTVENALTGSRPVSRIGAPPG